ncbi:putative ankyrin repeat-containing domain-containing protein [Helianthus anomalus]
MHYHEEEEEEGISIEAELSKIENSISEDTKELARKEQVDKKRKEAEERAKVHQSLYEATLSQSFGKTYSILKDGKVKVTDKITINGNTALHVAVGTTKNMEFIDYMLTLGADDNPRLDMQNSEGSTLLHVAAIVGNLDAAKILVEKNHDLLFAKDKDGHTPLAKALSNMHTDTCLYLLNHTNTRDVEMGALFDGTSGDELLVNAISSKDYYSALVLSKHYRNLHSDAVLMAIAQNFPQELNIWDRTFYKCTFVHVHLDSTCIFCLITFSVYPS